MNGISGVIVRPEGCTLRQYFEKCLEQFLWPFRDANPGELTIERALVMREVQHEHDVENAKLALESAQTALANFQVSTEASWKSHCEWYKRWAHELEEHNAKLNTTPTGDAGLLVSMLERVKLHKSDFCRSVWNYAQEQVQEAIAFSGELKPRELSALEDRTAWEVDQLAYLKKQVEFKKDDLQAIVESQANSLQWASEVRHELKRLQELEKEELTYGISTY